MNLYLLTSKRKYKLVCVSADYVVFSRIRHLPPMNGLIVGLPDGRKHVRLPFGADGTTAFYERREREQTYLPTAEQIAEASAMIRAEWSEDVERERRCFRNRSPDYGREIRMGEPGPS